MRIFRCVPVVFLVCVLLPQTYGQLRSAVAGRSAVSPDISKTQFFYANRNEPPRGIEFGGRSVTASYFISNINRYLGVPEVFSFVETESNTDKLGMHHRLMQQYYRGLPVEGMMYRVHEREGFVTSANGRAVREIPSDVNVTLTEEQAFGRAVAHLGTTDTVFRTGRRLIVSKDFSFTPGSFSAAFQFDIDVSLVERWRISVHAVTGEVINKMSLVNTCFGDSPPNPVFGTGTGISTYYGKRDIKLQGFTGGSTQMLGETENGGVIGTFDFGNRPAIALFFGYQPDLFHSWDNTYNRLYDRPAVSVHWGAEQVYEYFYKRHNRRSFDNNGGPIHAYVHVDVNFDNAFWNGRVLAFGDGSRNNPLVELDVVGHEVSHGVTQYEAALYYWNEPGALNESFSDILAKAIEFDVFGDTATWQIAKYFRSGGLRDMSNPNLKEQPDTYHGEFWAYGTDDNGGVHYNSGVQNFWFYLLCEGGSGVNDHQVNYSVNAIGIEKAVNIAYRNLTEYLTNGSEYFDSRVGSLLATADLYGRNSAIYKEVEKAWDAVGVIDEPIIQTMELFDITATTVKVRGTLLPRGDTVSYFFEFGTTPSFGSATASQKYSGKVEGIVRGLQAATKYYLRLVAVNENGNSYLATEFTTLALDPLVNIRPTVDVTETTALLHGDINPNSLPCTFYFEYGTTPALGSVTPTYSLPDTTEFMRISATVSGLMPRQTYFYRLVANNGFSSVGSAQQKFFTASRPVMISFSPVAAHPGAELKISGKNFGAIPAQNVVHFGAVSATVLSASSTELTVKVPAGASLGPVSVTDLESALSAESVVDFVPTFTGEFGKGSLQLRAAYREYMGRLLISDMDGDNRPDIVGNYGQGHFILQNVNDGGDITEDSFVRNDYLSDAFAVVALVDLDGNGLKDIAGRTANGLRIYPNFSTPGFMYMGVPVDVPAGYFWDFNFRDFDGDGHLDFVVKSDFDDGSSMVRVFRNQTPKGYSSGVIFEEAYSERFPYQIGSLSVNDLNNDGLPEVIAGLAYKDSLCVLKNNGAAGIFSFARVLVTDTSKAGNVNYVSRDFNQDGWNDLVAGSFYENLDLYVLRNLAGSIVPSFSAPAVFKKDQDAQVVAAGDINGDGKVDLLAGGREGRFVNFINKTVTGQNFSEDSFEKVEETGLGSTALSTRRMLINDLNGDGRPEVVIAYDLYSYPFEGYRMEIWQNSPYDCLDPSLVKVEVSRYSAKLIFPQNTTLDHFEVELAGGTEWGKITYEQMWNLAAGTTYRLRVRAKCYLGFTDYHYTDFTTDCTNVGAFSIGSVGIDFASVNRPEPHLLEVQYTMAGMDDWATLATYDNTIRGLLPGTTYDIRVRGLCPSTPGYRYLQLTTYCPAFSSIHVGQLAFNKAVLSGLTVYLGSPVLEYSRDNIDWIPADDSGLAFPLEPGTDYVVRGRMACTDISSDYITTSFTTPCPAVSALRVDELTPFTARVTWNDESATGRYTVTYKSPGSGPSTVQATSTSLTLSGLYPGTRYEVSVAPACRIEQRFISKTFQTVCYSPFALTLGQVTQDKAELSWSDNVGGFPYTVDYTIAGTNAWTTTEVADRAITLQGLTPGTEYEARVYIDCPLESRYAYIRFGTGLYSQMSIAPNPTAGLVTVYPARTLLGSRFVIYDIRGRPVAGGTLLDYNIDLSGLSAGIYTVVISGERPVKIVRH